MLGSPNFASSFRVAEQCVPCSLTKILTQIRAPYWAFLAPGEAGEPLRLLAEPLFRRHAFERGKYVL
jgi:hypothetical protein